MGRLGCWVACRLLWDCDRASSRPGGSAGAVGLLAWVGVRGCRGAARECRWRGGLLDALRCAGLGLGEISRRGRVVLLSVARCHPFAGPLAGALSAIKAGRKKKHPSPSPHSDPPSCSSTPSLLLFILSTTLSRIHPQSKSSPDSSRPPSATVSPAHPTPVQ